MASLGYFSQSRCRMRSAGCGTFVCGRILGVGPLKASASIATISTSLNEGTVKLVITGGNRRQGSHDDVLNEGNLTIGAVSSGLDFIDLVGLDDFTVMNRLQDAVTYRVLVGGVASKVPRSGPFNLKQLKSYRDNVTRNLAPTVAWGFANAARAAGHSVAAKITAAPAPAPAQRLQPLHHPSSNGGSAAVPTAAASRVNTASASARTENPKLHVQSQAMMSYASSSSPSIATGSIEYRSCSSSPLAQGPSSAAFPDSVSASALLASALLPTSVAHLSSVPGASLSEPSSPVSGPQASSLGAQPRIVTDAGMGVQVPGEAVLQPGASEGAGHEEAVWGPGAPAGRRRGSRGADRGSLYVGAGRQEGGVRPAWI